MADKELILRQIKLFLGIKSDADFARHLGIKPQTLSTWYARNTFDYELLYSKCEGVDANYLLTGKGDVAMKSYSSKEPSESNARSPDPEKTIIELQQKIISLMEEISDLKDRLPVTEQPIVSTTRAKNVG
jgi:hypothetical protein